MTGRGHLLRSLYPVWVSALLWLGWLGAAGAEQVTLANHYRAGVDVRAYWVSEKYDGVRGYWDGQQLRSRQGLPIDAPAWFTAGWPAQALDGELWAGRNAFATAQRAVALGTQDEAGWRQLRYMVFDAPGQPGGFAQRQQAVAAAVQRLRQPWVQAVPQWQVPSHAVLMEQLQRLSAQGAEGLMLRRADSPYRAGRSDDLLKLKLFEDAEAVVLAHLPGKGKYAGLTGALLVQMPSGQRFKLGSGLTDADRAQPPAIGAVVTYRFNGTHASGIPRFARYWRVREQP